LEFFSVLLTSTPFLHKQAHNPNWPVVDCASHSMVEHPSIQLKKHINYKNLHKKIHLNSYGPIILKNSIHFQLAHWDSNFEHNYNPSLNPNGYSIV